MKTTKYFALILLITLSFGAGAEDRDQSGPPEREGRSPHHPPGPSIERAAMHRLVVDELARRTQRPAAEIQSLFENSGPRAVAEELGLEREQMHEAMTAARQTLIQRMQAADLLSAEDSQRLRSRNRAGRAAWSSAASGWIRREAKRASQR